MKRILACAGLFAGLVLIGFSLSFARTNVSQDSVTTFEVKIQIYGDAGGPTLAEHLVAFTGDVIYSFPSDPVEAITIIDLSEGLVTLVRADGPVHTSISHEDLLRLTAELRAGAADRSLVERLGIKAEVQHDGDDYRVAYGEVDYHTTTRKPEHPSWAEQFGQFTDWVSRVNIAQQRGLPPFGRMRMNARIAADARVPVETRLTHRQGDQSTQYRSTHRFQGPISDATRTRIDKVNNLITLGKYVPLVEF